MSSDCWSDCDGCARTRHFNRFMNPNISNRKAFHRNPAVTHICIVSQKMLLLSPNFNLVGGIWSTHHISVFCQADWFCACFEGDSGKVTTVVATPGQGPDRPQEVSYTDIKVGCMQQTVVYMENFIKYKLLYITFILNIPQKSFCTDNHVVAMLGVNAQTLL